MEENQLHGFFIGILSIGFMILVFGIIPALISMGLSALLH
jgi:hypothetical protein